MTSNLLITRNKENGIVGGGYTLNSVFLNSGIPAFTHSTGGQSGGRSRPKDLDKIKVSDVIEYANGNDKVIVPAGIFMVHGKRELDEDNGNSNDTDTISNVSQSRSNSKSKTKSLADSLNKLYRNHSDSGSDSDSDFGSGSNSNSENESSESEVISNDLYQKLLTMVSPDNTHKYWNPNAPNTRRRKKHVSSEQSSNHNKNKSRKRR
jgi:hypothetical protein